MRSRKLKSVFPGPVVPILFLALVVTACGGPPTASPAAPHTPTLAPTNVPKPVASPSAISGTPRSTSAAPLAPAPTPETAIATPVTAGVPALESLSMQGAMDGWGLSQDAVFHTNDGGSHWMDVTPKEVWQAESIVKGSFLDPETGWVVQPSGASFGQGLLYRTHDGGRSWETIRVPFGPNALQFLSATDGWVMADRGAAAGSQAVDIYKTTDGGATWKKVASAGPDTQNAPGALPLSGDKIGMAFKDMHEGWIGGTQPIVGHSYLYRTTDGGRTWRPQDLSIPAGYVSSGVLVYAPRFTSGEDGVLPVLLETQLQNLDFYITHDGGQTWQSSTVVPNGSVYQITPTGDIWAWAGGYLQFSHDGGKRWTSIASGIAFQGQVKQLDFLDGEKGWVISRDASEAMFLYRTTDGGRSWTQLSN